MSFTFRAVGGTILDNDAASFISFLDDYGLIPTYPL